MGITFHRTSIRKETKDKDNQMQRSKIVTLLSADTARGTVLVKGWVRTRRDAKDFSFIEVNDGSSLKNVQVKWFVVVTEHFSQVF